MGLSRNPAEPITSKVAPHQTGSALRQSGVRATPRRLRVGSRRYQRVARGGTALFATEGEAEIDFAPDFELSHGVRNLEILQLQHFRCTSVPSAAISHER